jgi:hypothetical protein
MNYTRNQPLPHQYNNIFPTPLLPQVVNDLLPYWGDNPPSRGVLFKKYPNCFKDEENSIEERILGTILLGVPFSKSKVFRGTSLRIPGRLSRLSESTALWLYNKELAPPMWDNNVQYSNHALHNSGNPYHKCYENVVFTIMTQATKLEKKPVFEVIKYLNSSDISNIMDELHSPFIENFMKEFAPLMSNNYELGKGLGKWNQGRLSPIKSVSCSHKCLSGIRSEEDKPMSPINPNILLFKDRPKGVSIDYSALKEDFKNRFCRPAEVIGIPLKPTPNPVSSFFKPLLSPNGSSVRSKSAIKCGDVSDNDEKNEPLNDLFKFMTLNKAK